MSDNAGHRKNRSVNRIWLILAVVSIVLVVTHYVILPVRQPAVHTYSNSHLKPKNYLNSSDPQPNPFEFCPLYGPGDHLGTTYGAFSLSQSRLHLGSGHRVQKVLNRALAGQPVTISILGGSGIKLLSFTSTILYISSIGMSWCRRRPNFSKLLSISLLYLVELGISSSSYRINQRRNETRTVRLFQLL